MIVQLAKWGNSLAFRIPATYAKEVGAVDSGRAELTVEEGKLILRPLQDAPEFDLNSLISGITDENRHDEITTGPSVGAEFS